MLLFTEFLNALQAHVPSFASASENANGNTSDELLTSKGQFAETLESVSANKTTPLDQLESTSNFAEINPTAKTGMAAPLQLELLVEHSGKALPPTGQVLPVLDKENREGTLLSDSMVDSSVDSTADLIEETIRRTAHHAVQGAVQETMQHALGSQGGAKSLPDSRSAEDLLPEVVIAQTLDTLGIKREELLVKADQTIQGGRQLALQPAIENWVSPKTNDTGPMSVNMQNRGPTPVPMGVGPADLQTISLQDIRLPSVGKMSPPPMQSSGLTSSGVQGSVLAVDPPPQTIASKIELQTPSVNAPGQVKEPTDLGVVVKTQADSTSANGVSPQPTAATIQTPPKLDHPLAESEPQKSDRPSGKLPAPAAGDQLVSRGDLDQQGSLQVRNTARNQAYLETADRAGISAHTNDLSALRTRPALSRNGESQNARSGRMALSQLGSAQSMSAQHTDSSGFTSEAKPLLEVLERSLNSGTKPDNIAAITTRVVSGGALVPGSEAVQREMRAAVQEQVMQAMTRQTIAQGRLTLQLNPHELGALDIEFKNERGEVQVSIVARENSTRELLDSVLPRLRQTLQEAGVNLGDLDVRHESTRQDGRNDDRTAQDQPSPLELSKQNSSNQDGPDQKSQPGNIDAGQFDIYV